MIETYFSSQIIVSKTLLEGKPPSMAFFGQKMDGARKSFTLKIQACENLIYLAFLMPFAAPA